jgi:hypothetical protein
MPTALLRVRGVETADNEACHHNHAITASKHKDGEVLEAGPIGTILPN